MQTLAHELKGRFRIIGRQTGHELEEFAEDVRRGLTSNPKRISPRYLYDRRGSWLFEKICDLEEYYQTRAETQILERYREEISDAIEGHASLIELGSGSSIKTRILLGSVMERGGSPTYVPIDVSRVMLAHSGARLARSFPSLDIAPLAADYDDALSHAHEMFDSPMCIIWLGSSIGNLDRDQAISFMRRVWACMDEDDRVLVGIDLRKDPKIIHAAYDDSEGVTKTFNSNILRRINRELDADFDTSEFDYHVHYDAQAGRVDMYQVSRRAQTVNIDMLDLSVEFEPGEKIWTESAVKYSLEEIDELAKIAGMTVDRQWINHEKGYTLNLFAPQMSTS